MTSDAVSSLKKGRIIYTAANTCKFAEHRDVLLYQVGCELTNQSWTLRESNVITNREFWNLSNCGKESELDFLWDLM